jgi:hypothetical protein
MEIPNSIKTRTLIMPKNYFNYVIIAATFIIVIILLSRNLDSPNLWFDESGQFWMAKGLNHFSPPLQAEGNIKDVIHQNAAYNLDPGGFTIILHFWTKIANAHIWLRLLPFLFFILTMMVFSLITFKWTNNLTISLFMSFVAALSPLLIHYAFEVRPYSMEYLGTVLTVYFVERFKVKINNRGLMLFGCLMAIFMTSRYAVNIPILISVLIILFLVIKNSRDTKQFIVSAFSFGFPLLVSSILIYTLTFRYQIPNVKPPVYVLSYMLKYKNITAFPDFPAFIIFNIPFIFFVGLYLYCKRYNRNIANKFDLFFLIIIANNLAFIILSFLGINPWHAGIRWCITLNVLSFLCVAAIGCIFYLQLSNKLNQYLLNRILTWTTIISCITTIVLLSTVPVLRYKQNDATYDFLSKVNLGEYKYIYVNGSGSSTLRYLFEYGALKSSYNKKFYPDKFDLSQAILGTNEHVIKNLNEINPNKYDLIILSQHQELDGSANKNWTKLDEKGLIWSLNKSNIVSH